MAVPTTYLTTTKNLDAILAAVQKAGVPSKFTYAFLTQLGFPSSADRPIIPVLKALRFLDDSGVPLDRYRRFKDASQAGTVLAEAMRQTYADVFGLNQKAHDAPLPELKGMFARLSDKGSTVTDKMAMTFQTLAKKADFSAGAVNHTHRDDAADEAARRDQNEGTGDSEEVGVAGGDGKNPNPRTLVMHHDVHVHLPVSTEIDVYDAIFRSLRQNLLG